MAVVFAFFTLQVVCVGNAICLWCPSADSFQFGMLASNMCMCACVRKQYGAERKRESEKMISLRYDCGCMYNTYGLLNSVKWTGVGMFTTRARVCVRTPFINFYAPYFTEVIQNVRPLYCNARNKWHAELETMYLNYVPEAFIQWHHFTLEVDPSVLFPMLSPMFLFCCCYHVGSATSLWFAMMLFVFVVTVLFVETRIPMHFNKVENISSSWSSNFSILFDWSKM